MSLPVLQCRRSCSASVKRSRGYYFRLPRQRLLLINSRLKTAVRLLGSTPLCVAVVSIHVRGGSYDVTMKPSPSLSIRKTTPTSSPASFDTEPDIYPMRCPG